MKIGVLSLLFFLFFHSAISQVNLGEQAPEITLPDANGQMINLSSLRGKVVLIDFWASWCGPCRASIPGIVKLYKKYKDKGFIVLGVSLDDKKNSWLKAIKHDKITYLQVNDKDGWYSRVAARYNVNAIPATFLLDRAGRVVSVDPEGKELLKSIEELLAE